MKVQEDRDICKNHYGGLACSPVIVCKLRSDYWRICQFCSLQPYMYAPAVLVTPLGALSIIVSAVLAHFLLQEKLRKLGILRCVLCVVGYTIIVLHAPSEHDISSVDQIWELATQPAFLLYIASAVVVVLVMSTKAVGIAIKLTLEGYSQALECQCSCSVFQICIMDSSVQALDTFTSLTIFAIVIMFKDCASDIVSVLRGFIAVLSGTMVLHSTREPEKLPCADYSALPQISWVVHSNGEIWKQRENDELHGEFVAIIHQNHFK
ncbi:hypothetical protein SASPL_100891 [Salvia splendens]|uniref:Probable magnesium transporter n=1 Tax=Salvia splendens TaxID=180675 RepID=A0A8X8YTT8_SALSN|nr:hypothetical protein SASPL_100891 [Salvia splendens]